MNLRLSFVHGQTAKIMQSVLRGDVVGLVGLGVTCSPLDLRFSGSNPTKIDGFFQDVKILSPSLQGAKFNWRIDVLVIP